jgi:hypothetical protein
VQNELRGCELAAQFAVKGDNPDIFVEHLSSNINTPETEFAPFPFGDEALYFSSTMAKRAEIYRSIKSGSDWSKSTPVENFPVIENDHFCNGSLTPDANRFYFTICKSVESWGGLTTQCQIYVTRRVGKSWTPPEKLPDYVNEAGVTTTHPFVVHDGNTEVLYFSTNRNGGLGGMDIWYTTREINSTANDFTLPINAGSRVNTIGDDISWTECCISPLTGTFQSADSTFLKSKALSRCGKNRKMPAPHLTRLPTTFSLLKPCREKAVSSSPTALSAWKK